MNSLTAFLSTCALVNAENDLQVGSPTVLLRNGQPASVFDRTGQQQPFTIMLISEAESLTKGEVATLANIAEQADWIVVVDQSNQVCGVVEPQRAKDLQIAAKETIRQGEFGSTIKSPLPHGEGTKGFQPKLSVGDHRSLRDWWHEVLRDDGPYRCYAFFLCLPSDKEAVKYIANFGKEIDFLSHNYCLVITLSKTGFRRSGYDEAIWNLATSDQISKGYSMTVAQLFKIKYTDFPCIVFFEDVRSPNRVAFSFKGLEVDEIAKQMRMIFTVIQQTVISDEKPITNLARHQGMERINIVRQSAFSKLFRFIGATFEKAMEAWFKASV